MKCFNYEEFGHWSTRMPITLKEEIEGFQKE